MAVPIIGTRLSDVKFNIETEDVAKTVTSLADAINNDAIDISYDPTYVVEPKNSLRDFRNYDHYLIGTLVVAISTASAIQQNFIVANYNTPTTNITIRFTLTSISSLGGYITIGGTNLTTVNQTKDVSYTNLTGVSSTPIIFNGTSSSSNDTSTVRCEVISSTLANTIPTDPTFMTVSFSIPDTTAPAYIGGNLNYYIDLPTIPTLTTLRLGFEFQFTGDDISYYEIYKNGSYYSTVNYPTYVDDITVSPDVGTQLKVRAFDTSGNPSVFCTEETFYPVLAKTTLTLGTATTTTMELNWTAITHAPYYYVYYKKSSEGWINPPTTVNAPTTTKTITGLDDNTSYDFKVITYNPHGVPSSAPSDTDIVKTKSTLLADTPPTWGVDPLNALTDDVTSVGLTWDPAIDDNGISTYEIYKKINAGAWNFLTLNFTLSYADSAVSGGNTYTYKLKAKDTINQSSDFSNERSINL